MTETSDPLVSVILLDWDFEFVSDFVLRISDFDHVPCSLTS